MRRWPTSKAESFAGRDTDEMGAASLLFVLIVLTIGTIATAYALALALNGKEKTRPGMAPTWVRYHVRYYSFALLFIAFDMEMAYMYPWAVVIRDLGWFAFAEMGFFLMILGLGILYAWREGALRWS